MTRATVVLADDRAEAIRAATGRGHALGRFSYARERDGQDRGWAYCANCGRRANLGGPYADRGTACTEDCDRAPAEVRLRELLAAADGARVAVPLSPQAVKTLLYALNLAADTIRQNVWYGLGYEPTLSAGNKALAEIRRARIELLEARQ